MRSRSTGVLNQTDSETEVNDRKLQNRLMQPTISSQNKIRNNANKSLTLRKRFTHSAGKLS